MGTCTMVRMMRGGRGRGGYGGFLPVQMVQPSQRLVLPASSVGPPFYSTTRELTGTCIIIPHVQYILSHAPVPFSTTQTCAHTHTHTHTHTYTHTHTFHQRAFLRPSSLGRRLCRLRAMWRSRPHPASLLLLLW